MHKIIGIVSLVLGMILQLINVEGIPYSVATTKVTPGGELNSNTVPRVVSTNVKVISARGSANGQLYFDAWSPSQLDIETEESNAATTKIMTNGYEAKRGSRQKRNLKESVEISSFESYELIEDSEQVEMSGEKKDSEEAKLSEEMQDSEQVDYIDVGRERVFKMQVMKATQEGVVPTSSSEEEDPHSIEATVELLIICDMEWGRIFDFNRRKILNYFIVYFSDVAMRFRTIPNTKISFRITGIVVVEDESGQPFIENAKGTDGKANMKRILPLFASWIYEKRDDLPKFDIAAAITNTPLEWYGGLAYLSTACFVSHSNKKHYGTLVFNDDGSWKSVSVAAHELGHSLGAPHDADKKRFPEGCNARGYVMSGNSPDLKWFFSTCSSSKIGDFIRSENGACLTHEDESPKPTINHNFGSVFGPTMDEQCKRKLKDESAFVPDHEDRSNCFSFKCAVRSGRRNKYKEHRLTPVENTICKDNGRCLRGRCRRYGSLLYNLGSGNCVTMYETDRFDFEGTLLMGECNRPGSPLERFSITDAQSGTMLGIPWHSLNGTESGEKCLWTGYSEGCHLYYNRCDADNVHFVWDFIDVGNAEFLLSNRVTKYCAKAKDTGEHVQSYQNCDRNDPYMRWKLH